MPGKTGRFTTSATSELLNEWSLNEQISITCEWLEMQIIGPHFRSTESELLSGGPTMGFS